MLLTWISALTSDRTSVTMTYVTIFAILCCTIVSLSDADYAGYNEVVYSNMNPRGAFPIIPKTNASSTVIVTVTFYPIRFKMDPEMLDAELDAWVVYRWTDNRLGWSSTFGIEEINIPLGNIWRPDIVMMESPADMSSTEINSIVTISGNVIHLPAVRFNPACSPNSTNDNIVTCIVTLGSWSYHGGDLDLQMDVHGGLNMREYGQNRKWLLEDSSAVRIKRKYDCCPGKVFPQIRYSWTFRRIE